MPKQVEEAESSQEEDSPRKDVVGAVVGGALGVVASRVLGVSPKVGFTVGGLLGANARELKDRLHVARASLEDGSTDTVRLAKSPDVGDEHDESEALGLLDSFARESDQVLERLPIAPPVEHPRVGSTVPESEGGRSVQSRETDAVYSVDESAVPSDIVIEGRGESSTENQPDADDPVVQKDADETGRAEGRR